jgi:hypothetical protein
LSDARVESVGMCLTTIVTTTQAHRDERRWTIDRI